MVTFLLGADPEVFLNKRGRPVSASETGLPGDKKSPHKTSNGAVQVDGTAAEFNIDPVESNRFERFNLNIVETLRDLKALVPGCNFSKVPVQEYTAEYLASLPDSAKELGCDPDYCAYTGEKNPIPDGTRLFRTGAGHVHIGWGADIPADNEEHIQICCDFVKMLDVCVGPFMTFIDREPRRRELYGKAGAFRPKSYGVEYRTPSNAWIWNRDRRLVMHYLINQAIANQAAGRRPENVVAMTQEQVREMIDTGDVQKAESALSYLIGRFNGTVNTALKNIKKDFEDKEKAAA